MFEMLAQMAIFRYICKQRMALTFAQARLSPQGVTRQVNLVWVCEPVFYLYLPQLYTWSLKKTYSTVL